MSKQVTSRTAGLLTVAFLVTACGGGGEQTAGIDRGGVTPPPPDPVVSVGRVTGFGSVIVNGTRWNTDMAEILIEAVPGREADLAVGQIVRIEGTLGNAQTGTARRVVFDDVLDGPVESVNAAAGTLSMLGQIVHVDADTIIGPNVNPAELTGIMPGQWLSISGFWRGDGSLAASWLDRVDAKTHVEIAGRITDLDLVNSTFRINGLTIDFSALSLLDVPGGSLTADLIVNIRGVFDSGTGTLDAVEIGLDDLIGDLANGVAVEIQGIVTRFAAAQDFDLLGIPTTTNGDTVFVDGTSADLGLGAYLTVSGRLIAGGQLVAERITFQTLFEPQEEASVAGVVDSILVIGQGPLAVGQLQMLGIDVSVLGGLTTLVDGSARAMRDFSAADIVVGDYIEAYGIAESEAGALGITVLARRVERLDAQASSRVSGMANSVSAPELDVLGLRVQTNAGTRFFAADGASITPESFFGQAAGRHVECEGTYQTGMLVATDIRLRN